MNSMRIDIYKEAYIIYASGVKNIYTYFTISDSSSGKEGIVQLGFWSMGYIFCRNIISVSYSQYRDIFFESLMPPDNRKVYFKETTSERTLVENIIENPYIDIARNLDSIFLSSPFLKGKIKVCVWE